MIRLNRGECPKELTDEAKAELTNLYIQNKDRDVWNSPKIKKPIKEALMEMSNSKCAYCECVLGIESKDVTIDHFLPKSKHEELVVEWENLLPSCLRCNRNKRDNEEALVNPCMDRPIEFIALDKGNLFRLKGIDPEKIGKNTIRVIGLNDIERVMKARMGEWEDIHEKMEEIYEDLLDAGYQKKYKTRFEKIMQKCTAENSYAAIKATNMLNDELYFRIKDLFMENNVWKSKLQELENELKSIALRIV